MRKKYIPFAVLILTLTGYHAYKRQAKRQHRADERAAQKAALEIAMATENLEAQTETHIHLPAQDTAKPLVETETIPNQEALSLQLKEDAEIQSVADITWISCEEIRCQLATESKVDNLPRFKRAFVQFLKHNPEHGPYWKFVPSEDYDRAMRVIFSHKPI